MNPVLFMRPAQIPEQTIRAQFSEGNGASMLSQSVPTAQ
jgi:hypothetical protein